MSKGTSREGRGNFEGLFKGLTDFIEKLGELAEKGEELSRTGEFQWSDDENLKGVYGFSMRMGLGGQGFEVEPFGNIRKDEKSGQPVVQEISEPVVDVFEEEDYTLVVAEMPGVSTEDVELDLKEDLLAISADRGKKKYRKEVLLPKSYPREKMQVSCNNGILEIKCTQ